MPRFAFAACAVVVAGLTFAPTLGQPKPPEPSGSASVIRYLAPLAGRLGIVRAFDPPTKPYGPGHLGVDLRATEGATVRAPYGGTVRFAGAVAGRGVVVIEHPDGIRTEYEPVLPSVRVGARVRAAQPIGLLRGRHHDCPGVCLHWGARRGSTYLDPLRLLAPLGPVVLLPDSRRTSG